MSAPRKIIDDYQAKLRLWAEKPEVIPAFRIRRIPGFTSRKFSSYEELAAWKREVLEGFIRRGETPWI